MMAKVIHRGPAKPDHPSYKLGPVVGGKRFGKKVVSPGGSVYRGHNVLPEGVKRMPSVVTIGNRPRPKPVKLGKKPKSRKVETARTSPSAFFTNSGPGYDDLTPEEQKIYDEQLDAFYDCDLDD